MESYSEIFTIKDNLNFEYQKQTKQLALASVIKTVTHYTLEKIIKTDSFINFGLSKLVFSLSLFILFYKEKRIKLTTISFSIIDTGSFLNKTFKP